MTLQNQALEDKFSSFQMKSDGVMNLSKSQINLISDISSHHQFIHLQNSQKELMDKNNNLKYELDQLVFENTKLSTKQLSHDKELKELKKQLKKKEDNVLRYEGYIKKIKEEREAYKAKTEALGH